MRSGQKRVSFSTADWVKTYQPGSPPSTTTFLQTSKVVPAPIIRQASFSSNEASPPLYQFGQNGFDDLIEYQMGHNPKIDLSEYGVNYNNPGFVGSIEKITEANPNFRFVIYTSKNQQLVAMNLKPQEDIGQEVHDNVDQFFRVESGTGFVIMNGIQTRIESGTSMTIPMGTVHNVINSSRTTDLKLYSIYSGPQHPFDRIDVTKPIE